MGVRVLYRCPMVPGGGQGSERVDTRGVTPFVLGHVTALDGLRGLAVAGVLAFHGNHLVGGYLGVDLFFVLSGFLITSLLLREWQTTGSIALGAFWGRRARRLLPALFGLLGGVAIYALVWAKPYELGGIRSSAVATVAYVANWQAIWSGHGYWDLFTTPSPLQHTWSLAIEEQFYLVWPLAVLGMLRLRAGRRGGLGDGSGARPARSAAPAVFAMAVVLAAASTVWMMTRFEPGADPSRLYFGTDTRAGSVLMGAALAALLAWRGLASSARARVAVQVIGGVAVVWLAYAWLHIDGQSAFLYQGGFLLSGVAVVAVIAACVTPGPGPLAAALSIAPLRGLGLISYGLYLWHWPIFVVLQLQHTRLGLDGWALFAVQVAVSLAFALVSYHLLERPIRFHGVQAWGRSGRALMPVAAALTVVLVVLATTGAETRPEFVSQASAASSARDDPAASRGTVPTAVDDPAVGTDGAGVGVGISAATTAPVNTSSPAPSAPAQSPDPAHHGATSPGATSPGATPFDSAAGPSVSAPPSGPIARPSGRPARLLVVGDSVARYLGDGIDQQPALGVQVGNQAMYKCTLGRQYGDWRRQGDVVDPENADCRRWPRIWGDAVARFRPDAALVIFGGPPQGSLHIGDGWFAPCTSEYRDYQRGEVEAAVAVLGARGATVYLAPAAHARFPFLPDDIDQRTDCVNQAYRDVAAAHPNVVRILPIDDWTCPPPGRDCVEQIGGVELRDDGIHYRGAGAQLAAAWLVPQIFRPAAT